MFVRQGKACVRLAFGAAVLVSGPAQAANEPGAIPLGPGLRLVPLSRQTCAPSSAFTFSASAVFCDSFNAGLQRTFQSIEATLNLTNPSMVQAGAFSDKSNDRKTDIALFQTDVFRDKWDLGRPGYHLVTRASFGYGQLEQKNGVMEFAAGPASSDIALAEYILGYTPIYTLQTKTNSNVYNGAFEGGIEIPLGDKWSITPLAGIGLSRFTAKIVAQIVATHETIVAHMEGRSYIPEAGAAHHIGFALSGIDFDLDSRFTTSWEQTLGKEKGRISGTGAEDMEVEGSASARTYRFRNALNASTPCDPLASGYALRCGLFFSDNRITGGTNLFSRYEEVGIYLGGDLGNVWSPLSSAFIGGTYDFGNGVSGYRLNFGYRF